MELKRFFPLIILLVFTYLNPDTVQAQKVRKVVIDAGHGGHDPGATGKTSREKDITLALALKTGKYIEENMPDVQVIYTRKTDVFVELYKRAKIANEAKADLFISIHCNANKSTTPYGAETYVMGLHKSEANLAVAQTENAAIMLEDDYHVKYDGFDPTSPEGYIFFTMLQNAFLDQSLMLASNVQKHFKERVNLFDRGVKQAGFLVLYKTTMPAVLIETGFISNAKEEKILASEEGQNYLASAIFRAVKDYKRMVEKTPVTPDKDNLPEKPLIVQQTKDVPAKQERITAGKPTQETGKVTTDNGKAVAETIKPVTGNETTVLAQNTPTDKPANLPVPDVQPIPETAGPSVTTELPAVNTANAGTSEPETAKPSQSNIVFKVQFLVAKSPIKLNSPELKGLTNVDYYLHNGMCKYTYGNEENFEAANLKVKELNKLGFKDCFVVAFLDDKRITIEEAKKMLGN